MPPPTGYGLLFNGALVVLSPVVAVVTQANILYAILVLVPIYAVERMARLSAERERTISLDTLTSLANRGMLRERFDRLAATYGQREARRSTNHLALLMLDLDRFKDVNKSLGHEVGDQLLKAVTLRLTTLDTDDGLVARVGGDEFAVLARVPDSQAANALGLRAVEALREPVTLESLRVYVTVSIGVALWVG
jgi:diguanylate cyclase (GGDEF)-like protein